MAVSYSFDGNIILIRMEGIYSTSELKTTILKSLDAPECPANPVMMFDLRESRSIKDRSAEDVRDMAMFLASQGSRFGNRLGMVAPTDLTYGMMRIGAVIAERGGVDAFVFREFNEAREWLLR